MSENLDLVPSIHAGWESRDYGSAEWAHPEIEYVIVDGPRTRQLDGDEVAEQLGDTKETCLGTYAGLFADYDERNRVSAEEKIWAARAKVRPQSVLKMTGPPKNPEPTRGLEPRTPSLRVKCSTS
jgi:hypothetical protein